MSKGNPRARWRTQIDEPWLVVGQAVRDGFGTWWIACLPDDAVFYEQAQVGITAKQGGEPERRIWLDEFIRDFLPITDEWYFGQESHLL